MHEGEGNCLKYLKEGWDRKERMGYEDFIRGEASWVGGRVP